jgi:Tfp pilus assembly protein FimV
MSELSGTSAATAAGKAARLTAMAAAVAAAEAAACLAREDALRDRAAAATAGTEVEAMRASTEQRRADLDVLRNECTTLRWKVHTQVSEF